MASYKETLSMIGDKASALTGDAKQFVGGYVEWAKQTDTVKTLDDYRQYLAKAGKTVSTDVYNTASNFITTTDTGKALSHAASKTQETAADAAHISQGFLGDNKVGIITGLLAVAAGMATGLGGLAIAAIGLAAAAAGNFLGDKQSGVIASFSKVEEPKAVVPPASGSDDISLSPEQKIAGRELMDKARDAFGKIDPETREKISTGAVNFATQPLSVTAAKTFLGKTEGRSK